MSYKALFFLSILSFIGAGVSLFFCLASWLECNDTMCAILLLVSIILGMLGAKMWEEIY